MARPAGYQASHPEELFNMMKEGKKGAHLHAHFGIHRKTFWEWLKKYPEFNEAYEKGLEHCEKHWEDIGIQMIQEKDDKAFKPWIAFMNRNFGWAKNGEMNNTINITSVNVFQDMKKEQLIAQIQEYLQELPVIDVEFAPTSHQLESSNLIIEEDKNVLKKSSDESSK